EPTDRFYRLRYIIHRLTESQSTLSSFSVGEGWQRRTVICFTSIRLSTQEEDTRPKKREGSYVSNKMGKGRTGWRPKKNRKPDQALYVPRGRFGGRGNNMAGDMSRKSQKEEEKREETEKPGDVHLQVVESVGEGENLEKGEENELGEGCAERERKISIEDEVEITSAVQTTEESEKRVKCLKAEEEKQKENEEDMQTERTDHGEENQPRSGDINATKQNSELCESRRAELHIIISPSGETQKLGAVMQPSELGSPESISEENRREPGDILLPERPAETTEGSLAECTDLPGPSEAKDSENKGTERNQGENKGENKQCAQNNKGDTCTIIGGHEAAVASEEAKSLLCDSYRQGDAQEEGISEPALDAASPAESGILQQIIKEVSEINVYLYIFLSIHALIDHEVP
uniref:Uncharacterized protein n=1 Tax=Xenopus tropicalis TaxID=8364 RepID=A0A6I8SL34_XENTR